MAFKKEGPDGLVEGAKKADSKEFVQLVEGVLRLLENEQGQVGNLQINGRLVSAPPVGEAIVVGDLHGDLEGLVHVLGNSGFVRKASRGKNVLLVFLGDYGDRGFYSPEVYYVTLRLKEMFPEKVVLMRGNHEGPRDILAQPHDLPSHLSRKFSGEWPEVYEKIRELFGHLKTAVLVEGRCIMLHGGVPSKASTIDDLAYAHKKHPQESHLEEILWSDPIEGIRGIRFSPRGAGRLFGQDVTDRFLNMLHVNALIRGHEPSREGFKLNHQGKVLTVFSTKGPPYYNDQGAYLQLGLSEEIDDARQLRRYIRTF